MMNGMYPDKCEPGSGTSSPDPGQPTDNCKRERIRKPDKRDSNLKATLRVSRTFRQGGVPEHSISSKCVGVGWAV
jgi:hypothetical protein